MLFAKRLCYQKMLIFGSLRQKKLVKPFCTFFNLNFRKVEASQINKKSELRLVEVTEQEQNLKKYFFTTKPKPKSILADIENNRLIDIIKSRNCKFLIDNRLKEINEIFIYQNGEYYACNTNELEVMLKSHNSEFEYADLNAKSKEKSSNVNIGGTYELKIQFDKVKNFSEWYSDVLIKSELIDYYDVSGCYILRPWAYSIWEAIQKHLDKNFESFGVKNAYFPIFVTEDSLNKEKNHIAGFSPEVAWVTKSGDTNLENKIAIRPTSETIMYPYFSKWIKSHRDLPLLINQWCNVVRWEFKHPTPFIRTREFLWQEGHTVHESNSEAEEFSNKILSLYKSTYEDLLAVPVVPGIKSYNEKFAGADKTLTLETLVIENGRAIQCATSHQLGTNFSKMFEIGFLDQNQKYELGHQTSWGFTTRAIGVAVMVHGDNKGLVIPPKVAPIQVVVIPILKSNEIEADIHDKCNYVIEQMKSAGLRVHLDNKKQTPGFKFNYWEQKGVPIRIEIGKKDLESCSANVAIRDLEGKSKIKFEELKDYCLNEVNMMTLRLFNKAKFKLDSSIIEVYSFQELISALNKNLIAKTVWCESVECEENVKSAVKAELVNNDIGSSCKTLCIPFEQEKLMHGKCFFCKSNSSRRALWGKSF